MLSRSRIVGGIACALALTAVVGCTQQALQFSPTTLPDAQVGSPYAATITVSQAETFVTLDSVEDGSLPAGLKLELVHQPADMIQISGTPTVAGTFSFTIRVRCVGYPDFPGQTAAPRYTLVVR
jgi:Putative Ig domain.